MRTTLRRQKSHTLDNFERGISPQPNREPTVTYDDIVNLIRAIAALTTITRNTVTIRRTTPEDER